MTNGKFKPYYRRGASHEALNQQRANERQLDSDLVGSMLYETAKALVAGADKLDHSYIVHAEDFNALAAAVRLAEKRLKKAEKTV